MSSDQDKDKDIEDLQGDLEGASEKQVHRRLTPAEWAQADRLWELGASTLQELSEQFGIRIDSLQRSFAKRGIKKGARAGEVGDVTQTEVADQAAVNAQRIAETKDTHYKYAEALARLTMNEIVEAKRASKIANADPGLAALNKAAKTLEVLRKERYALLGLDKEDGDPDEIPELLVSEMTPEQIERMQASMRGGSDIDSLDGLDTGDDIVTEDGGE